MLPSRKKTRQLKQIAHHLHPVVTVGERGITPALQAEAERALTDHELIKVKIQSTDRAQRDLLTTALASACAAQIVQKIGKVAVLYRENPDANPRLSNLTR